MKKATFLAGLAAPLLLHALSSAAQTADTAARPADAGAAMTTGNVPVHRLKTSDAVLPRWAFDLGYRTGWLSQTMEFADQTSAYGPNQLSTSRLGKISFSSGQSNGGDVQLSYFFDKKRHFGIGIGAQYMRYTGTTTLDTFVADYQSTDSKGRTYRQIIRSNAPLNEDVDITNVNVPVLLRFKHQFGRPDRPRPVGIWADAGGLFGFYNRTQGNASGSFSYEAVYKLSPDKMSVVSGFDGGIPPNSNTSLVLTEASYRATNNDAGAAAYFDNLHRQDEGFNIGLNKSIAPSQREAQKTQYDAVSFGAIVQAGISYQLSYHVTFMVGGYFMYQSWRNTDKIDYRFTDKIVDEGGASYANYRPITASLKQSDYMSYGINAGLRIFFGEKKDVDGDKIPDNRDRCKFVYGLERFGGCPDTDGDGITDAEDACPDLAGPESTNGCPDADQDGVADKVDKCPNEFGELRDGCPVSYASRTAPVDSSLTLENGTMLAPHIVLQTDVLYFATGRADILDSVTHVLDNAIRVLEKQPKVVLYISGHTDDKGNEEHNLYLSYQRANAARIYLERKGVSRDRVIIGGYGMEKPALPNSNDNNRAKNRRAELKLLLPL